MINATQINVSLRREWLDLAAARRLPTMAPYRGFGAMLSFYRRTLDVVLRYQAITLGGIDTDV